MAETATATVATTFFALLALTVLAAAFSAIAVANEVQFSVREVYQKTS